MRAFLTHWDQLQHGQHFSDDTRWHFKMQFLEREFVYFEIFVKFVICSLIDIKLSLVQAINRTNDDQVLWYHMVSLGHIE